MAENLLSLLLQHGEECKKRLSGLIDDLVSTTDYEIKGSP